MSSADAPQFSQADASTLLVHLLKDPSHGGYSSYGYGLYIPNLIRTHLAGQGMQEQDRERKLREMSPMLYAAAWDLCRRGILRPGIRAFNEQSTPDGASGNGYTLTPFGTQWLAEADQDSFVPTE